MNTNTNAAQSDPRVGRYLSGTGVVHTSKMCGTKSRRTPMLITAEDVEYWTERDVQHDFCAHCTREA